MANAFEEAFGIPLPKCCNLGECCKGASPSKPYQQLMARAAEGDEFARNFFSIMVPYPTQADAEKVVPGLVQRMREAARKLEDFQNPDDLVFYHCRYLDENNRCGVHEDRPQFCRDYPDTPYVVTAPGCAFEGWVSACKQKYQDMQTQIKDLKALKADLQHLKESLGVSPAGLPELGDAGTVDVVQNGGDNDLRQMDGDKPGSLIPLGFLPVAYLPRMTFGSLLKNILLYTP